MRYNVMNSGYDGNPIFEGNKTKSRFLDYLEEWAKKTKIRLFVLCVMMLHIITTTWYWKTPKEKEEKNAGKKEGPA